MATSPQKTPVAFLKPQLEKLNYDIDDKINRHPVLVGRPKGKPTKDILKLVTGNIPVAYD